MFVLINYASGLIIPIAVSYDTDVLKKRADEEGYYNWEWRPSVGGGFTTETQNRHSMCISPVEEL